MAQVAQLDLRLWQPKINATCVTGNLVLGGKCLRRDSEILRLP